MKRVFAFILILLLCFPLFTSCSEAGGANESEDAVQDVPHDVGDRVNVKDHLEGLWRILFHGAGF